MGGVSFESEHPKKRRRRQPHQPTLPAYLVLDDTLRRDVGLVSEKLWQDLVFMKSQDGDPSLRHDFLSDEQTIFFAIRLRTPLALLTKDIIWMTLGVQKIHGADRPGCKYPSSTIWFPASSPLTPSFSFQLEILDPHQRLQSLPIEICATRVQPLRLDTLYITVDKSLLESVDDAQAKFGGGFSNHRANTVTASRRSRKTKIKGVNTYRWNTSGSREERLARVLREAVHGPPVIHTGDALRTPLPSHPITHIPPPPTIVTACEPVSQGLVSSTTRIVLVQTESSLPKTTTRATPRLLARQVDQDDVEDTSNEQFYSATEDGGDEDNSAADELSEQSDSDQFSWPGSQCTSDDLLDDMISLQAPALPSQRSVVSSGTANATPRPSGKRNTSSDTPASLQSSFTTTRSNAGTRPGKLYRAAALLQQIPTAALCPKIAEDEDDSSFVFVDMKTLTKVGCFSGDWVRLEGCNQLEGNATNSFLFNSIRNPSDDSTKWRVARIFAFSNLTPRRSRHALSDGTAGKRSTSPLSQTSVVYIPPVLLFNVGAPSFVRLLTLPRREPRDPDAFVKPPLAKEITLSKVATPCSTKKEVQSSLFAAVKDYFRSSSRITKEGDLIAVALDEEIGRVAPTIASNSETNVSELIATRLGSSLSGKNRNTKVVWFTVVQVVREDYNVSKFDADEEDAWGGVVTVSSSTTRMTQAGNCFRGIPEILVRNTAIWLGTRKAARRTSSPATGLNARSHTLEPYVLPLQKRLADLIHAVTSSRAISLGMPPLAILLHSTQRRIGKSYIASAACATTGTHVFRISAHDVLADAGSPNGGGDEKTEVVLKTMAERASSCGPRFTALLLTHLEALTADRMVGILSGIISESRVVIATTTELEKVPSGLRSLFTHDFEMIAPNESERQGILHNVCMQLPLALDKSVCLKSVALKTAALVAGDLIDVVQRASLAHDQRIKDLAVAKGVSENDVWYAGGSFVSNVLGVDFEKAIAFARSSFSDSIGAPKIPSVRWDDVGGLADQKSSIMETVNLPLIHPELFARGMRKRSGILFYGPPGTGKTLLAKAIATELSLNFFSVKGPELLNMYIGESEANVRRVFQRARDARPCVVFFDELDSVAPKRGNQGDSGGVMDRIVSQLLAELDGMSSSSTLDDATAGGASGNAGGVFVIGATNRPDLLDPALLRPGRFDKMLYLGVSSTHEQQVPILEALTRKFTLAPTVALTRIAAQLPLTYTGADLYALCSDAMLKAITRKTKQVDSKVRDASKAPGEDVSTAYYFDHLASRDDLVVVVDEEDFAGAQRELNASVSAKELAHFERIRQQFEQQDLSSSKGPAETSSYEAPRLTTWASLPLREQRHSKPPLPKTRPDRNGDSLATQGLKERGQVFANPDSGSERSEDDNEQTQQMASSIINGHGRLGIGNGVGTGKGKGKGKSHAAEVDGFLDDDDEEEGNLYT